MYVIAPPPREPPASPGVLGDARTAQVDASGWWMGMYVCMYVCMYIYNYIYIYIYVCMHMYIYIYIERER